MKQLILLCLCLSLFLMGQAQVYKIVDVTTAGTLKTLLTSGEKTSITDLTLTGKIDASDVKCLRDEMSSLTVLNINNVSIQAYNGNQGTNANSTLYPVNEIPQNSFYFSESNSGKTSLKSIVLPKTATSIGNNAFGYCRGLTNLIIPVTVTSIGNQAFYYCKGLTGIVIPEGVTTLGSGAFYNCSLLRSIVIPNSMNSIGDNAFFSCSGLTNITIGNGVTTIGNEAFSYCSSLTRAIIGNAVTSIGNDAFSFCSGLTSLIIPNSVTLIGSQAFYNCSGLKIIKSLNDIPPVIEDDSFQSSSVSAIYVSADAVGTYQSASGWNAFSIVSEKRVTIYNPLAGGLQTALIAGGYGPLSSITQLTITGNLNSEDILQIKINMTALTDVDLSGVTLVSNGLPANAFQDKTTLVSIKLPASIQTIGDYAFAGCTLLSSDISLPTTLTSIGSYAFQNCKSMTGSIIIPNSVTSIGSYAFQSCTGLKGSLVIGNSVTSIGSYAFNRCSGLNGTLTIPNSVTTIGNYAFEHCTGFTGLLTIPNSVSNIGTNAFQNCSGITGTLTLPNTITTISDYAFWGCTGLSGTLIIPLSVSSIGSAAFIGCTNLTELYINKNTTVIGDNAFLNCSGLEKVSVPLMVPPTIYANTFSGVKKASCLLEVPTGSVTTYQTANYWSLFSLRSETELSETYGITFQIGTGGEVIENKVDIENGMILTVDRGITKTLTVIPDPGYELLTVTYNGVNVKSKLVNNAFITPTLSRNSTLTVTFKKSLYKLSIQTGEAGAMNMLYEYGSTPSFDFTPSTGWKIYTIFFNNDDVTSSMVDGVYTVPPITGNSTLKVAFVSILTDAAALSENSIKVYTSQSEIRVEGIIKGEAVSLFTINGTLLQSVRSQGERIVLSAKTGSVYLVKTLTKTFKVIL